MVLREFGKQVLVAVDVTADWHNVVAHGVRFARMARATVHLVHVVEPPPSSVRRVLSNKALRMHMARARKEAARRMEEEVAADLRREGVPCAIATAEGKPERRILEVAKEVGAGLIVAGAGVTEGTEWLFVGTTADRLVRNAKVPVLIVGTEGDVQLKRIMVPVDFDRADQGAVKVAAKIGRESKGRVSVFHTYARPSLLHGYIGDVAALRREAKDRATKDVEEFLGKVKLPEGVPTPHRLMKAHSDSVDPAEAIVDEATRLEMDLIVMALGGISFFESFMIGAVAERVIRTLPCSLLALPTSWARRR